MYIGPFSIFFSPFWSFPFILQLLFALTLIFWRLTKKHQVFFCNKFFSFFRRNKKLLQDWSLTYLCRTNRIYFFLLWTTSGVTSKAYDSPELTYLFPQLFKTDLRRMCVFFLLSFYLFCKKMRNRQYRYFNYQGMNNRETIEQVERGYRMAQPSHIVYPESKTHPKEVTAAQCNVYKVQLECFFVSVTSLWALVSVCFGLSVGWAFALVG